MYRALPLILVSLACQRSTVGSASTPPSEDEVVTLVGAGSTFLYPLVLKWASQYRKAHPKVITTYQSVGSGAGIKAITDRTADFGATDAPMTESELKAAPGIVHVPVTSGAVVPVFNVPGVSKMRLTPELLAAVFLGRIKNWSDAALARENGGAKLPDLAITVVHRTDSSGTTAIFTDYLSKVSPEWRSGPGSGKTVAWPVGTGGRGNELVTTIVGSSEGAIGYVELAYALANKLSMASVRNRDGEFVTPTLEGVSAASEQANIPEDFRVSITDAPGRQTWPISGFSWVLVYPDQQNVAQGTALLRLLWWVIHDGQSYASDLGYAPLSPTLVQRIEQRLKKLKVRGRVTLADAR